MPFDLKTPNICTITKTMQQLQRNVISENRGGNNQKEFYLFPYLTGFTFSQRLS